MHTIRHGYGPQVNKEIIIPSNFSFLSHYIFHLNLIALKTHLVLVFLISLTTLSFAQQKQPYKIVPLNGNQLSTVDIKTSGGSITLLSAPGEQSRLEIYLTANGEKNQTAAELASKLETNYNLQIENSGNKLRVEAQPKSGKMDWRNSVSVSCIVYVSREVSSQLLTSGGSISLKGVSGKHKFMTSGGSITVQSVTGDIDGKTSGGSITIRDSKAKGTLTTSGGSITAANLNGDYILKTSGGSLSLTNLSGKIDATTSGGSITGTKISGLLQTATSGGSINLKDLSCALDAATSGGTMQVSFASVGEFVQLRNSSGNINLSIPKGTRAKLNLQSQRISAPDLANFKGDISERNLSGTLNGGGTNITATASSGKISLQLN